MFKTHREYRKRLTALGVEGIKFEQGRKHCRVSGIRNGKPFEQIIASTPSDVRALRNNLADIKRRTA